MRIPSALLGTFMVIAGTMTGCGTDADTPDVQGPPGPWTSGQAVVEAAKAAGFACSPELNFVDDQVVPLPAENPTVGGFLVICEGFQVVLMNNPEAFYDDLRGDCASVTQTELQSDALQRQVVVGENFVVSGTGEDQSFPADVSPQVVAEAFQGKVRTLYEFYEDLCPDLSAT